MEIVSNTTDRKGISRGLINESTRRGERHKATYSDGWRYLEAAPAGWSGVPFDPNYGFGCYRNSSGGANMVVGTKTEIGTGEKNTADLVSAMGDIAFVQESGGVKTLYAAKVCADYSGGGHDDWFLPSRDEAYAMYTNLYEKGLGEFKDSPNYRTSSQYRTGNPTQDKFNVYTWKPSDDSINLIFKNGETPARAVRAF